MKRLRLEPFFIFLLISLAAHLGLILSVKLTPPQHPLTQEIVVEYVEHIDEEKPEEKGKTEEERELIVDSQFDPSRETPPPDTNLLSEKNQTVDRETRAAQTGDFKNAAPGQKSGEEKALTQTPVPPKSLPTLADLSPSFDTAPIQPEFPQPEQPVALGEGVSQTDDYLTDKQTDIHTMLNTREFVYFSYYSRIKKRLKEYWEPQIKWKVERMLRQGRSIASARDRITKLVIVLNKKGILVGVKVIGESGIRDLDDAAIEAFRSAAPFPNPPDGIIESDGTIKIRWDFVLEA